MFRLEVFFNEMLEEINHIEILYANELIKREKQKNDGLFKIH